MENTTKVQQSENLQLQNKVRKIFFFPLSNIKRNYKVCHVRLPVKKFNRDILIDFQCLSEFPTFNWIKQNVAINLDQPITQHAIHILRLFSNFLKPIKKSG